MARHGSLAEQLAATLAWRNRPETEGPIEVAQTNWSTVPANDNNPEDVETFEPERRLSIRPTEDEIMREVAFGKIERGPDVWSDHFKRMVPGPIVRIGSLRFSDGTQAEKAYANGPDGKIIRMDMRMPLGAMLGTRETQERVLGGGTGTSKGENNSFFSDAFKVKHRKYTPNGKRKKGRNYTRDESADMLVKAIENTPNMPEVKYCEPGLALGTARVADNFIGMKKMTKAGGGSFAWTDICSQIAERESWLEVEIELSGQDKETLERAMTAKSFAMIGEGGHKRTAERRGKRLLKEANDNLADFLQKYVS